MSEYKWTESPDLKDSWRRMVGFVRLRCLLLEANERMDCQQISEVDCIWQNCSLSHQQELGYATEPRKANTRYDGCDVIIELKIRKNVTGWVESHICTYSIYVLLLKSI